MDKIINEEHKCVAFNRQSRFEHLLSFTPTPIVLLLQEGARDRLCSHGEVQV